MDLSGSPPRRPKGILKNADSFQHASPEVINTPERPGLHGREMSEKEITLNNTLQNAGPRRPSSTQGATSSRRQSGSHTHGTGEESGSPRLKWDEANLYLTEQQRDSTMKITEPKTPYAKQYDPAEDEEEIEAINANELVVDELDQAKGKKAAKEDEIPSLDLGEPENEPLRHTLTPDGEKRVIVDTDMSEGDIGRHGEETDDMTQEERVKHQQFEAARRKHYEMRNVKDLLGHPEDADADEDDESSVPSLPNGTGA